MRMGLAVLTCALMVSAVAGGFHEPRPCAKAGKTNMEASGNANVRANVPTALELRSPSSHRAKVGLT